MAGVTVAGLSKYFAQVPALKALDLELPDGEFLAVLGPSGCGKTTLLRLIAGFERATAGTIHFDGELQESLNTHVPPENRGLGMVFQSYALWPHMSVAQNVGYPLRVRRVPQASADERVRSALTQVGLQSYAERSPAQLSGGQRQRVALARCLVSEPRIVLFDEPLANLDVHLRESMQETFRNFHRDSGATVIYVTHDQAEAMALADRIAVLDDGVLQQVAPPRQLYAEPATEMVANFVGQSVVVPVAIKSSSNGGYGLADIFGIEVQVRGRDLAAGPAKVCLRPADLSLVSSGDNAVAATVESAIYRGAATSIEVRPLARPQASESRLLVETTGTPPREGDTVFVQIHGGWCFGG